MNDGPAAATGRPANLRWYLGGTASWFAAFGMQLVLFQWLVAIQLREPPDRVGLAQMAMLLPTVLFVLIGGLAADRWNAQRQAMLAHIVAALPPLGLAAAMAFGELNYTMLIAYALAMGTVQAFVAPARDGLLVAIAQGRIQRVVTLATGIQFGVQLAGFAIAWNADLFGAAPLLVLLAVAILGGAVCFGRLSLGAEAGGGSGASERQAGMMTGLRAIFAVAVLRHAFVVNLAMGLIFMAIYVVGLPLIVREIYHGSSAELALVNISNTIGIMAAIAWLLRRGGVARPGRALLLSMIGGGAMVALMGIGLPFWGFLGLALFWGAGGGIAISMVRSLMQGFAPAGYRGRVMSLYALSLFGGAPFGAVILGYLIDAFGMVIPFLIAAGAMIVLMLWAAAAGNLWHLHAPDSVATN